MSYRFQRTEAVPEGISRIVIEQLDDAHERLCDGLAKDPDASVHEARKDMKKARSGIRLVRESLGERRYRADNERLRSAGRRLSHARDAAVREKALAGLRDHYGDASEPDAREAIADATVAVRTLTVDEHELERAAAEAVAEIDATRASVAEAWSLDAGGWDAVSPGLELAYRRGRKTLRALRGEPSDESVHELRKRAKDLWYHQRLLRGAWPGMLDESVEQAHRLTDLLGDHHDLALLEAELPTNLSLTPDGRDLLATAIRGRKDELLAEAIELGERVYAEKPGAYSRRLHAYWCAWRA